MRKVGLELKGMCIVAAAVGNIGKGCGAAAYSLPTSEATALSAPPFFALDKGQGFVQTRIQIVYKIWNYKYVINESKIEDMLN